MNIVVQTSRSPGMMSFQRQPNKNDDVLREFENNLKSLPRIGLVSTFTHVRFFTEFVICSTAIKSTALLQYSYNVSNSGGNLVSFYGILPRVLQNYGQR